MADDPDAAGREVRISNSAYTITANFDAALTVTIPIYCWGEYTITADNLTTRTLNITNNQYDYITTIYPPTVIYDFGYDPYNIALLGSYGTYDFQKHADRFYVYGSGNSLTWMGCAAGTDYIDVTDYNSIEVTYGDCVVDNGAFCALLMANSSQMSGYWWHNSQINRVIANSTVVTDISHLTGLYRIGVTATAMTSPYYVTVYKIVLK